jgi:hypothetical protein
MNAPPPSRLRAAPSAMLSPLLRDRNVKKSTGRRRFTVRQPIPSRRSTEPCGRVKPCNIHDVNSDCFPAEQSKGIQYAGLRNQQHNHGPARVNGRGRFSPAQVLPPPSMPTHPYGRGPQMDPSNKGQDPTNRRHRHRRPHRHEYAHRPHRSGRDLRACFGWVESGDSS